MNGRGTPEGVCSKKGAGEGFCSKEKVLGINVLGVVLGAVTTLTVSRGAQITGNGVAVLRFCGIQKQV